MPFTTVAPLFIVTLPSLPVMVIVSDESSPNVTLPLSVDASVTDKVRLTLALLVVVSSS